MDMVSNMITSLGKNGLNDWFIQRVSAIILLVYILFVMGFILCSNGVTFEVWQSLFSCGWMKVFTVLAVLSLLAHTWIGIWTILTDYIHCAMIRGTIQTLAILGYVACFAWVIQILWA
jgi:succinate dehydrogenase / fumarate reductase, membrane anchor subunit